MGAGLGTPAPYRRVRPIRPMRPAGAEGFDDLMGLFRRDRGPEGQRFVMRQKLLAIGDDFWIEDDSGDRVYKVNGKAFRIRQTFVLEDRSGREVARIQERKLTIRDKIAIERDGAPDVTVRKALVGLRDRFAIDALTTRR